MTGEYQGNCFPYLQITLLELVLGEGGAHLKRMRVQLQDNSMTKFSPLLQFLQKCVQS